MGSDPLGSVSLSVEDCCQYWIFLSQIEFTEVANYLINEWLLEGNWCFIENAA